MDRKILHCDMNSFYCSVELLDHPELKDKPVAVAGDPRNRHGIILAKNQIAKQYGISTPDPVAQALRRCPELVLLEPHYKKYSHYYKLINNIYLEYTDMVEPFSIDESWLDVTGSEKLFGSAIEIADTIRNRIRSELGLTLSVGVSFNKVFAKMGSEYKKPDATTEVTRENFRDILWPLSVDKFFFVGKSTASRLNSIGIRTVGELATTDERTLQRILGQHGTELLRAVNGLDDEPVRRWGDRDAAKSVGHGITFRRDICGRADLLVAVTELADRVSTRLRHYNMKANGVKVDITDPTFARSSKQHKVSTPISTAASIKSESLRIIEELGYADAPIRLMTITAINLESAKNAEQLTIFSLDSASDNSSASVEQRNADLEHIMDKIRNKFGGDAIGYGHSIDDDIGLGKNKDHNE